MYQRFGEALQKKNSDHPVDLSDPSKKDVNMGDAPSNTQQPANPGGQAVPATHDPTAPAVQPQPAVSNHNPAQTSVVPQQQSQSQPQPQPASLMQQTSPQASNPTRPVSSNHVSESTGNVPTAETNSIAPVNLATTAATPAAVTPTPNQPATTPVVSTATPIAAANTPVQVSPTVTPSPVVPSDIAGPSPVSQTQTEAPLSNTAIANSVTDVRTNSGNPNLQQPQPQAPAAPNQHTSQ